ncbi:30S ribosomal protein S9, partial [candidate division WOR-3 bacterium]
MDNRIYATGTRKRSVAKVWIRPGTGKVVINAKDPLAYFQREDLVKQIMRPLETVGLVGQIDIKAKVSGGGISGQAGAVV